MNDNAPHYTEPPIAQLEENKGQIDGLPASHNTQLAKLTRNILNGPDIKETRMSSRQACTYHKIVIYLYRQSKAAMKYSEVGTNGSCVHCR